MPWGVAAAAVGSVLSSQLSSSGGGSGGVPSAFGGYAPNAATAQQDANQTPNPYIQYQPVAQSYLNQEFNNPYYAGAQAGAGTAGQMLQTGGTNTFNNGMTLDAAGNTVLNTAFDPQNALYNQQFQQNQDQTNASLSARGLNPSGVGAGISAQSGTNFNIDWENQQLQRQESGLQAAGGAFTTGGNLQTNGANNYYAGASLPNTNFQTQLGQENSALNTYGNFANAGVGYAGNEIGVDNSYAAGGQTNFEDNLQAYDANQNAMANQAKGIGSLLSSGGGGGTNNNGTSGSGSNSGFSGNGNGGYGAIGNYINSATGGYVNDPDADPSLPWSGTGSSGGLLDNVSSWFAAA